MGVLTRRLVFWEPLNRRSVLVYIAYIASNLGTSRSRDVLFGYRRLMRGNFGVTKSQRC